MMKSRSARATALIGAIAALTIALTGCSAVTGFLNPDAQRDESGQVQEDQSIGIFNLKVGDCKLADTAETVQATDVVPCDKPHDEEVYFEFELEGDELPDAETIETAVLDNCIPEFEKYVGLSWEESTLDVRWLEPSAETWSELDDRVVQCIIVDGAGGKLEASVKGAKI